MIVQEWNLNRLLPDGKEIMVWKPNVVINYTTSVDSVDQVHHYASIYCFTWKSQMVAKINLLGNGNFFNEFIFPLTNYDEEEKQEAIDKVKICEAFRGSMYWKFFWKA